MLENSPERPNKLLGSEDVLAVMQNAREVLNPICTRTEARELRWVERLSGVRAIGKLENQQVTGSFKFRGAYYRCFKQDKTRGVIAASAGNHGLAVAEAANRLRIPATICIPTTASNLKRERLAGYDHSIVQEGASLEETTEYAKLLAERNDWDFISPYNDERIIAGHSTIVDEFLEQNPELNTLVVPVGGGGLICAIGLRAKQLRPDIRIIGVEPEHFASLHTSLASGTVKRVTTFPTLADGLAVNLEPGSITMPLAQKVVDEIVLVSEEEMAAAVQALLQFESQLLEPAGAVPLAAILAGRIKDEAGNVGLILSGGNLSTAKLAHILHYPFKNENLVRFASVFGQRVADKVPLRGEETKREKSQSYLTSVSADDQMKDVDEDIDFLKGRFKHIDHVLARTEEQLREYIEFCDMENIQSDKAAVHAMSAMGEEIRRRTVTTSLETLRSAADASSYNQKITEAIQEYRALLHLALSRSLVLDWRSASYDQSRDTMFFHLSSQQSGGVNYNRYESDRLVTLEKQISDILGFNKRETSTLLTSSGMAAFSLLESYLLRHCLKQGDRVLIPQYLYFEADEQISSLPGIIVDRAETHDTDEIVKMIAESKPRVVFIDPLTNTPDLRVTDVPEVIRLAASQVQDRPVTFVIDGTMLSGGVNPFVLGKEQEKKNIEILYYESCSKYLQLGLDIAMGGMVAAPVHIAPTLDRLRRNTGTIMYDTASCIFPVYSREEHLTRMQRFSRNALCIADILQRSPIVAQCLDVQYPLLPTHPDFKVGSTLSFGGGILTFIFHNEALNQREALNSFIDTALHVAKQKRISLTKGVSFGFSIPRISAAAAMAENTAPFLRLSVGDRSIDETALLADALREAFEQFILKAENILHHDD